MRGYVSMCFGDPWEGDVDAAAVVDVVVALREQGCHEISLGDTIGVATPGQVVRLLDALDDAGVPRDELAVHFHDTYGQALSNTLVSLQQGITTVDASAGGLGGCPFAQSATGNLATEDLVWQLHGLGIETGVDLESLVATSVWLAGVMGRPSPSNAVRACIGPRRSIALVAVTTLSGGTSLATTAPAPTTDPRPMVTPGATVTAAPIHTSSSMTIGACVMKSNRSCGSTGWPAVLRVTRGPMSTRSPTVMPP